MLNLNLYHQEHIEQYVQKRPEEIKFGEKIQLISSLNELKNTAAKYVLLGIPEDVGVRANRGKAGTAKTWDVFLNAFLNIQANKYNNPNQIVLLGEIDCKSWMQEANSISKSDEQYYQKLGKIVSKIDMAVSEVIETIVLAGKIPIIIGGGHNNAYGIIKGCSLGLKKPISVANMDAHTDLRPMDFRHSGNGFSYALAEGFFEQIQYFWVAQKLHTASYI